MRHLPAASPLPYPDQERPQPAPRIGGHTPVGAPTQTQQCCIPHLARAGQQQGTVCVGDATPPSGAWEAATRHRVRDTARDGRSTAVKGWVGGPAQWGGCRHRLFRKPCEAAAQLLRAARQPPRASDTSSAATAAALTALLRLPTRRAAVQAVKPSCQLPDRAHPPRPPTVCRPLPHRHVALRQPPRPPPPSMPSMPLRTHANCAAGSRENISCAEGQFCGCFSRTLALLFTAEPRLCCKTLRACSAHVAAPRLSQQRPLQ
jgi:hypothetical protein